MGFLLFLVIIRLDDLVYQAVTNDIQFIQFHKTNITDIFQCVNSFNQSASLAGFQVGLGDIARDNHLGTAS